MPLAVCDIVWQLQGLARAFLSLPQCEAEPALVQLEAEQQLPAAPLEQHRPGNHGLKAEGDIAGHLGAHQGTLQQEVASAFEGEGGGGLAEGPGEAWWTGAGVSVGPLQQERRAGALVQALMPLAAHQPLSAVHATVEDAVMALSAAVACVASDVALAPASILAGTGLTLLDHLLAEGTCQQEYKHTCD